MTTDTVGRLDNLLSLRHRRTGLAGPAGPVSRAPHNTTSQRPLRWTNTRAAVTRAINPEVSFGANRGRIRCRAGDLPPSRCRAAAVVLLPPRTRAGRPGGGHRRGLAAG